MKDQSKQITLLDAFDAFLNQVGKSWDQIVSICRDTKDRRISISEFRSTLAILDLQHLEEIKHFLYLKIWVNGVGWFINSTEPDQQKDGKFFYYGDIHQLMLNAPLVVQRVPVGIAGTPTPCPIHTMPKHYHLETVFDDIIRILENHGKTWADVLYVRGADFNVDKDNFRDIAQKTRLTELDENDDDNEIACDLAICGDTWWLQQYTDHETYEKYWTFRTVPKGHSIMRPIKTILAQDGWNLTLANE